MSLLPSHGDESEAETQLSSGMLGKMPLEVFLEKYWQKRPVLLRGVFPGDFCPLSAERMLELALEEEADSRLIITGEWPPELYHGPFDEEDLADLPDQEWTLLVQEVDRLVPEIRSVLAPFRFVPNWRVDDVMVSWAAPGGGVGAHTDQYDVFLIQGLGRRRWEIGNDPIREPIWNPESEVAVLASFEPDAVLELEPGDVLYLPPHIAHNGVALTGCLTLSVGFRAPSPLEILEAAVGQLAEEGLGRDRFIDRRSVATEAPGEVTPETLAGLRQSVRRLLESDADLNRLLLSSLTSPVRGRVGGLESDADSEDAPTGAMWVPTSVSQMAYAEIGGMLVLSAAGNLYPLPLAVRVELEGLTGAGLVVASLQTPEQADPDRREAIKELKGVIAEILQEGVIRVVV